MKIPPPWVALAAVLILTGASPGRADGDLDEALQGFDDTPDAAAADPAPPPATSDRLRLHGILSQDLFYNFAHDAAPAGRTDHRGLSGLRSRLDLGAEVILNDDWRARIAGHGFYDGAYAIQGRGGYRPGFIDTYESEIELGEAHIGGKLGADLDIKLGRQIVVWGKSDSLRVTDVLNPLDGRLPGRTDVRDLRLPVTMAKLDYFAGDWNLSALIIPEIRFNKTPVFGSDFFTAPAAPPVDDDPDEGFGDIEAALALNGTFPGWDLALYAASIYNDQPHGVATIAGLRRRHARLTFGGISANVAQGNWLLKGEAAVLDGIRFFAVPGREFTRLDLLAGFEYAGIADTAISAEIANRHLFAFDARTRGGIDDARRNDVEAVLRMSRKFLNDTLDVTLLAVAHGLDGGNGGFQRLSLSYDWNDTTELGAGVINYRSGEKNRFAGTAKNDRVFVKVLYRF